VSGQQSEAEPLDVNNSIDILDSRDLFLQVKDSVLAYLKENELSPDERLPTNREFGRMFGVSALTVQRAMGALAKEKIVYSRRGRGTFVLNPARAGENLNSRTSLIACVVPSIQSNSVASTIFALDDVMFDDGGEHIIVSNTQFDPDRELRLLDSLLDRGIDALVYQPEAPIKRQPAQTRAIDERLQRFLEYGIPVVMLDEFGMAGRYDTIIPNDVEACNLAVRHLLDLGHRRLIFFGHTGVFATKVEAVRQMIGKAGVPWDHYRVVSHNDYEIESNPAGLQAILDEGGLFTGVIAASDHFALVCHRFLSKQGIQCPRDVSIVGSDNLEAVQPLDIPLTTVWCDPDEVANHVRKQLAARLARKSDLRELEPLRLLLEPKLVARGSTSAPRTEP
jgi:LacI family transcriptional regulator